MSVFANIDAALPAMLDLMNVGAHLVGLLYVGIGISEAIKKSADPRGTPGSAPIVSILSGGALMGFGYIAGVSVDTATTSSGWTSSPAAALSYWPKSANAAQQDLVTVLKLVQFFGYLGVFRGIMVLNQTGKSQQNHSALDHPGISGAMMIFFGGIAINIKSFLAGLASFFKFTLPAFLT